MLKVTLIPSWLISNVRPSCRSLASNERNEKNLSLADNRSMKLFCSEHLPRTMSHLQQKLPCYATQEAALPTAYLRLGRCSGSFLRRIYLVSLSNTNLYPQRYFFSTSKKEAIDPDEISFVEVETVRYQEASQTKEGSSSAALDGIRASTSKEAPTIFKDVRKIDKFSRGRVASFIKRYNKNITFKTADELFETTEIESTERFFDCRSSSVPSLPVLFHSRLRVPLSHPLWENSNQEEGIWAHGVASDQKIAEHLAAMHAERIIDELGYQIYSLPSMQRKHAAAAGREGRFAPLPDVDNAAPRTMLLENFPLPLRYVIQLDESEGGEWQLLELRPHSYIAPQLSLLSPCVIDKAAEDRIRTFFSESGLHFVSHCSIEVEDAATEGASTFYVASIAFPTHIFQKSSMDDIVKEENAVDSSFHFPVVARGKALSREGATTLACMHAELILDALHIPIFPQNDYKQKIHASSAWSFGRPAPAPGASPKDPQRMLLPLPLKELVVAPGGKRFSVPSSEEDLVQKHHFLTEQVSELCVSTVKELSAIKDLESWLGRMQCPRHKHPFFTERIQQHFKSTVVLPVPSIHGICGGIGVATSKSDADVLAAMHALDLLIFLGIPLKLDASENRLWVARRQELLRNSLEGFASGERPPGRRLGPNGFSRTVDINLNDLCTSHSANPAERIDVDSCLDSPIDSAGDKEERKEPATPMEANNATYFKDEEERAAALQREQEEIKRTRDGIPKDLWSDDPDSPDGYIMVAPLDPSSQLMFLENAIQSPRQLNCGAKRRVAEYLAHMGRRFDDVFKTQKSANGSSDAVSYFECIANIPVPHKFGDRIAVGKATSASHAEMLAAMHAELLLDKLGVPLFADPIKQQRHAKECAKYGRWAPKDSESLQDASLASPPPLRMEYAGSLHWERSRRKTQRAQPRSVASKKVAALSSEVTGEGNSAFRVGAEEPSPIDPLELNEIPDMGPNVVHTIVSEEDLDLVAKARVQYYLRRQGKKGVELEYKSMMGRGTLIHIATGELPLPAGHKAGGERKMEGIAMTKRDAEVLAWVHAQRSLDALGIQIFDNLPALQTYHAKRVKDAGGWAPSPDDAYDERSTTDEIPPLRLSSFLKQLNPPTLTSDSEEGWNLYIASCDDYIKSKMMQAQNIFFDQERVPRTGDKLVDSTLDEMESKPVDQDSKRMLQLYCNASEYEYPASWPARISGPISHRVSWVSVPVPGFPYIQAQGVGSNKEIAARRCAMHALEILKLIDGDYDLFYDDAKKRILESPTNLDSAAPLLFAAENAAASTAVKKNRRGKAAITIWDHATEEFTVEGKERLILLYTVCLDLPAPRIEERISYQGGIPSGRKVVIELKEEEGNVFLASGEGGGTSFNRRRAIESLFDQLCQGNPTMSELMEVLRNNTSIDPAKIPNLSLTEAQNCAIQSILKDSNEHSFADNEDDVYQMKEGLKGEDEDSAKWEQRFRKSPEEVTELSAKLRQMREKKLQDPEYLNLFASKRQKLSIAEYEKEIVDAIENNTVLILCGTTGCGKTTQVPQFIFDHYTEKGKGGECSILVTQPRRISAVTIAQRVAAERLERIGDICGYSIRFDTKLGKCINFCTSGVLLRMLHNTPLLEGINVLIIDEIHERDINSDFILVLLQDLLTKRPDLRVILMSATLQAELFSSYFNGAPVINVEGYIHPVKDLFLEDLAVYAVERQFMTPLLKEASLESEKDRDDMEEYQHPKKGQSKYGVLEAVTEIDYVAIQFAIEQAQRLVDLSSSSVLVFLPGWEEIKRAKEILERDPLYQILPLHSSVSSEEQMQCFLPAEPGKLKVILSTNIAESGVTIDDIGAVIDVGRAKEKKYLTRKPRNGAVEEEQTTFEGTVSQLLQVYASRANCTQRRGRVGRTRPGVCIRLYTRRHFEQLHDFQTPEMLRTPLDSLCLNILSLQLGDPRIFLSHALEPPPEEYINGAMNRLHELGATTSSGSLTSLGLRLSLLPVDPCSGKMILMGAVLKCLDSALTVASVAQTDVFSSQRDHREAARLHRENFSRGSLSDSIASVNGYNYWVALRSGKTSIEVQQELESRLLSVPQLLMVSRLKKQFFSIIRASSFLGKEMQDKYEDDVQGVLPEAFVDGSNYSESAMDVGLVKCVVASGLFPNIAVNTGKRLMRTKEEMFVSPSTDSVVYKTRQKNIQQPFFVYNEISRSQETRRLHVRGLTGISLWTMLLMGTPSMPVTFRHDLSLGIVDGWVVFRASFNVLELVRKFKVVFNQCLNQKFMDPDDAKNNHLLDRMTEVIKDLVNSSLKPNQLVDEIWDEKGTIIDPNRLSTVEDDEAQMIEVKELERSEASEVKEDAENAMEL